MAPHPGSEADFLKEKAQRDLLNLLEGVSKDALSSYIPFPENPGCILTLVSSFFFSQVRGKKNLVISKDLAGPVGIFVKFSVLQEYGVDRVFLLENNNVDSSQRNVVFLVRAEKPGQVQSTAGMCICLYLLSFLLSFPPDCYHTLVFMPLLVFPLGTFSILRRFFFLSLTLRSLSCVPIWISEYLPSTSLWLSSPSRYRSRAISMG